MSAVRRFVRARLFPAAHVRPVDRSPALDQAIDDPPLLRGFDQPRLRACNGLPQGGGFGLTSLERVPVRVQTVVPLQDSFDRGSPFGLSTIGCGVRLNQRAEVRALPFRGDQFLGKLGQFHRDTLLRLCAQFAQCFQTHAVWLASAVRLWTDDANDAGSSMSCRKYALMASWNRTARSSAVLTPGL